MFCGSFFVDCDYVWRFSQEHVLDALGVTDDWYRECNETLSLACRVRAPSKSSHPNHDTGSLGGPTDLLVLIREVHRVHEEYCKRIRWRNGKGQASSVEST